ncbi:MAG: hypothetical protein SFZ23_14020 [Planctomycetota bacterium]|nr:hypothetical protein [Planctomycetota bacterium]
MVSRVRVAFAGVSRSGLFRSGVVGGACVGLAMVLGACQSPPTGYSAGRIPVSESTRAEANDRRVQPADLIDASEQVAQELARDIQRLADEDFGGYRVTVAFGDFENKTGNVSTTDFEYVRDRVQSRLMTSRLVRNNIKFVQGRARLEELNQRELGVREDILQEGGSNSTVAARDPNFFFYLNGNMYRVNRGGENRDATDLYYIKYQLVRASDAEIVFDSDYEVKYGVRR